MTEHKYMFHKDPGLAKSHVSISNTQTRAVAKLGTFTPDMLKTLASYGHMTGAYTDPSEAYTFTISDECAEDLLRSMSIARKPTRAKTEIKGDPSTPVSEQPENPNDEIDMMDVLLGRAEYK